MAPRVISRQRSNRSLLGALQPLLERLLAPEILELRRRQFGVTNRVLNVLVPEVGLQRARIVAFAGQGVARGVPQHVRVRLEPELGLSARPLDHAGEAGSREMAPPAPT